MDFFVERCFGEQHAERRTGRGAAALAVGDYPPMNRKSIRAKSCFDNAFGGENEPWNFLFPPCPRLLCPPVGQASVCPLVHILLSRSLTDWKWSPTQIHPTRSLTLRLSFENVSWRCTRIKRLALQKSRKRYKCVPLWFRESSSFRPAMSKISVSIFLAIQDMMTANWAQSQRKKEAEVESDTSRLTVAEEAVSYHVRHPPNSP